MPSEQMTSLHPAMTQDRGEDEEARSRHKGEHTRGEGTDCKVQREQKSLRKQINENGIFQIGFGSWSRDGDRKHFHGFPQLL